MIKNWSILHKCPLSKILTIESTFKIFLTMSSLIQKIAREAQATFSKSTSDESFSTSLNGLLQSVNKLKISNLNLYPEAISKQAPLVGVPVFINVTISIDVFILQDGAKLPIHDHPGMYGISKVIYGTLRIASYNPVSNASDGAEAMIDDIETKTKNLKLDADTLTPIEVYKSKDVQLSSYNPVSNASDGAEVMSDDIETKTENLKLKALIPVKLHKCKDMTFKDKPCLITPTVGNYHQIRAVNGTAVLFDIVAPPYKVCHMYSLLETKGADSKSRMWLTEFKDMTHYWYTIKEYKGPKISV